MYVLYISACLGTVYDLPLLPNNTASETFLHRLGALRIIDYIYHWGARLAVTGKYVTLNKTFYKFLLNRK
jgi:hypothetical protein